MKATGDLHDVTSGNPSVVLRITGRQYAALKAHLYPGDGLEAAALLLCGRRPSAPHEVLMVYRVLPIPYDVCIRAPDRIEWPTQFVADALVEAERRGLALVKVHSHPGGYGAFSDVDDRSDRTTFDFVYDWLERTQGAAPHASIVLLPDGAAFGRVVRPGGAFEALDRITVVGDDLLFFHASTLEEGDVPGFAQRHTQMFGRGTFERLRRLSVAVVGCSGTGSPVVEQLARLGVGEVVLVDPDLIGEENLNRITNATADDVGLSKVNVLAAAVERMGTGTRAVPLSTSLLDPDTVRRVAACDVAFGCMDKLEGRDALNRLCAFYGLAYLDLGVGIVADGDGGVDRVAGAVHYLQPDGSSLLSRGVYSSDALRAEAIKRQDPEQYKALRKEKYIRGVPEGETPAVVSVNALVASLAINELLARLHPYRLDPNADFARWQVSLEGGLFAHAPEGSPCPLLAPKAGRGDLEPLLDLPTLSSFATTSSPSDLILT